MEPLQKVLERFDSWLWGNWLLFMLVGIGVLYTFVSSGIQVFHLSKILHDYQVYSSIRDKLPVGDGVCRDTGLQES